MLGITEDVSDKLKSSEEIHQSNTSNIMKTTLINTIAKGGKYAFHLNFEGSRRIRQSNDNNLSINF